MVKPNNDPKPAGPVRRAARAAARQVNVRAAGRKVKEIFAEELGRPDGPPGAQQLGLDVVERVCATVGIAGIVGVTVAAWLGGMFDAGLEDVVRGPAPISAGPSATCAELVSWCGGMPR